MSKSKGLTKDEIMWIPNATIANLGINKHMMKKQL